MNNIMIKLYTLVCFGLGACVGNTPATAPFQVEFLPSNQDIVSKSVFADLKTRLPVDSLFFTADSKEMICSAKLVEHQLQSDTQKFLTYESDPQRNRIFLAAALIENDFFAFISIVEPNRKNSNYKKVGDLIYEIEEGCVSIVTVYSDDY